jgi:hypothetical protein
MLSDEDVVEHPKQVFAGDAHLGPLPDFIGDAMQSLFTALAAKGLMLWVTHHPASDFGRQA